MRLSTTRAIACATLLQTIAAVPDVSVTPLATDCSAYPNYDASTGEAGPFIVVADSTGSTFDGNKVSAEVFTNDGVDRFGFITLPKAGTSPFVQNITLRCISSTLQAKLSIGWTSLEIAREENWQASLSFNLNPALPGLPLYPYSHSLEGVMQEGVFLGAKNTTTWTFKFNWGGNAGEYYLLRLLGAADWNRENRLEAEGKRMRWGKRQNGTFPPLTFPPDDRDWMGFLKIKERISHPLNHIS
ncbi:hypothetical protein CC78DRAFT_92692 [Lojkania enalia]|uniref:Uncharacterized protein n=1 Tax=Lojkania enalia TaxID=147567 RepID=A0A9P4KEL9_9PLEO|nr:hypothetical protein CC78DRAFT_92692 [Didymosphaeria enalia]